jgi:hypothetical protein
MAVAPGPFGKNVRDPVTEPMPIFALYLVLKLLYTMSIHASVATLSSVISGEA